MKAYLIFEDGFVANGISIGKQGESIGEMVFTTAMTGYVETLTDPSFFGQIIMQTFPMVGNYGAMHEDAESDKIHAAGFVVRELCGTGSNFRKNCELNDFLVKHGIVGIADVDTRELTKKVRDAGRINAMITDNITDLNAKIAKIKAFKIKNSMEYTSVKAPVEIGEGRRVVLWDFGVKNNIVRELVKRGCKVIKVPYSYTAEQILALKPQGVMLSNGGGNPADNKEVINQLKLLIAAKIPMFGICLGHQLLCLASGGKTKKLKFGHRGVNQPVRDTDIGRVYMTSQNHGYAAIQNSMPQGTAKVRFVNANDNTCEGLDFLDFPAFSVQFHPESCGGPSDTVFLFDRFVQMIDDEKFNG